MKENKLVSYGLPALVGAVLSLAALYLMGALVFPVAVFSLGFFVAGLIFPEILDELTGFGHTLWLPLGFIVVGFAGLYLEFGSDAFGLVSSSTWCGSAPCTPIGIIFIAFFLGTLSVLAGDFLSGKRVDLFGDFQKPPK